ncbi:phage head spike fiber domain-containing protein [Pirellulaceae bacterium SH449]
MSVEFVSIEIYDDDLTSVEINETGSQGVSAYGIAVANGFVGTEAEWLESLNGPNLITPETDTTFPGTGLLGHAAGKVTSVDPSQFATDAELAAGLAGKVDTTDPRLSDARTPLTHGHAISDVSGLSSALSGKLDTTDPAVTNAREWTAETISQEEAETGTATTRRAWTAERVRQAIAAWVNVGPLDALRPVVLTQPTAASVNVGDSLSLSCLGGILPNTHLNLTYQWQLSTDAGVSYNNITGATSPSIPFNPALVGNNGLYRCRLTNEFGTQNTNAVALTVDVSITHLFPTAAERGLAWDLDQIGTLWQNSTGTTPVTAYGDPVGKVDDVSGKGNNLIQATSLRRPTYARRPKSGVRNLLQRTEELENAYWSKVNATVTPNATTAADGTLTADAVLEVNGGSAPRVNNTAISGLAAGTVLTVTFEAKSNGRSNPRCVYTGNASTGTFFSLTGAGSVTPGALVTSATITPLSDGWYRCSMTAPLQAAGLFAIWTSDQTGNSALGIFLTKIQAEVGPTPTAYQRVTNQFDVTETGQPSINYLWFDGIDDCLQSATAIDFSNTDEMTVCVGARKLTDASQVVLELGDNFSNTGIFSISAGNVANTISVRSNGSNLVTANSANSFPPGFVRLLTMQSKISSDLLALAVNRVSAINSTTDQGTGNYSLRTLNLGSRNQASLFFSGHLNSGFVINRILNPLVLSDYERFWVAAKAGIDL